MCTRWMPGAHRGKKRTLDGVIDVCEPLCRYWEWNLSSAKATKALNH